MFPDLNEKILVRKPDYSPHSPPGRKSKTLGVAMVFIHQKEKEAKQNRALSEPRILLQPSGSKQRENTIDEIAQKKIAAKRELLLKRTVSHSEAPLKEVKIKSLSEGDLNVVFNERILRRQEQIAESSTFSSREEYFKNIDISEYSTDGLKADEEEVLQSLDFFQYNAVKKFLQIREGLSIIQGAPGTEKTKAIHKLLTVLKNRGERILVCTSSEQEAEAFAEICLKEFPQFPMIYISEHKKLSPNKTVNKILFDAYGQEHIQILEGLKSNLDALLVSEIVKGDSKFLNKRVEVACKGLEKGRTDFHAIVQGLSLYNFSCSKDLEDIDRAVGNYVELYCGYLKNFKNWKELLEYCQEEVNQKKKTGPRTLKTPLEIEVSRKWLEGLAIQFSSLQTKIKALLQDSSQEGLHMQLLNKSRIIFATLQSIGRPQFKAMLPVDSLIIDGAGESPEAQTIIPLWTCPKKCLLIGEL